MARDYAGLSKTSNRQMAPDAKDGGMMVRVGVVELLAGREAAAWNKNGALREATFCFAAAGRMVV